MSAIFGILQFDGSEVAARSLRYLSDAMAHRRPDASDAVAIGSAGLGHLLTRVNREDAFEAQPLIDRDAGLMLVADCRIDNRDALAAELKIGEAALDAMPDSQLILAAYRHWGEGCLEHLLGDFAFALWDGGTRTLLLARDHMGQRPLFYYRSETVFIFASDRHAITRHPDVPTQHLDDVAVARLLTRDAAIRDESLMMHRVTGFGGGCRLAVRADGSADARRYWSPRPDPRHLDKDEAHYIAAYRQVLGEAVACRLARLTVTPGLIFSGGYDSGGIAALAGGTPLPGGKLIAASSVMRADYDGPIQNARPWVERCARVMPWLDVRYVTREGLTALTGLEARFVASAAPADHHHYIRTALFDTLARAGVRVAMDGHGGDYTLNPRGHLALAGHFRARAWRRLFSELRADRRVTGQAWWHSLRELLANIAPDAMRRLWRRLRGESGPAWRDWPIAELLARALTKAGQLDLRGARGSIGSGTMQRRIRIAQERASARIDAAYVVDAAQHGMVLTRPFHDKRVVELALAIPESLYVKQGRHRYLACEALKDLYPAEFQTRPRRNDREIPDFQDMAEAIRPQIIDDIVRMEQSETLSRLIDFDRLRTLLEGEAGGGEQDVLAALNGYLIARYVEWERREN